MDGNRRWAKGQGIDRHEGHKAGFSASFIESVKYFRDAGIQHLAYYAFSTENWKRSKEEISYLMDLFKEAIVEMEKKIAESSEEEKVKVRFVGRREDFSEELQKEMNRLEEKSADYSQAKTTVWIALSYGGRAEIIEAVNVAVGGGRALNEEDFEKLLWTAEMPDPDIIVRTGGERRLSNFLTWRSVYSELYFIDTYWPALTEKDFAAILEEYAKRERRHGT